MFSSHKHPGQSVYSFAAGLACWWAAVWPGLVQAQTQTSEAVRPIANMMPDPLQSLHFSNYLIAILIVFVTLAAASWMLRRYQPRVGRGLIRVQACVSLGGKERLMLVEVQERRLLIGVCPAGIRLLQALDPEAKETPQALDSDTQVQATTDSWLQRTLKSVSHS